MCEDVIHQNTYTLIDSSYLGCAVADHIKALAIVSGTRDKSAVIRQMMNNEVMQISLTCSGLNFAGHVQINSQCCREALTELDPKLALAQAPILVNNQTSTGYQ